MADFAVINSSIKQVIHQSLAAMVVLPNRMLYKMDLASSYLDTYHAPLGIARITLVEGRGFVTFSTRSRYSRRVLSHDGWI